MTAARRRFPTDGHPGIQFHVADIETLDVVPGAPFDAAFSRMTLMLLADPVAGCATIRRSLRPGGRLAATVFRDGGVNPWLSAAMLGAAPHLGPLPPLPVGDEPGPFAFADPARLVRVLTSAGFTAVTITPCDVVAGRSGRRRHGGRVAYRGRPGRCRVPGGSAGRAGPARAGAARLLDRFREPGVGYRLPAGLWLVTATSAGADTPRPPPTNDHVRTKPDENDPTARAGPLPRARCDGVHRRRRTRARGCGAGQPRHNRAASSAAGSAPAGGSAVSAKEVCAYLDGQLPTLKGIGSETGVMANLTVNLYSWYEKQGPVPTGRQIDDQTRQECPATRTEVLKLAGMESFERL